MRNPRLLATASLIIGLLLLIITVFDLLALTDIYHDYVSRRVFEVASIPFPADLPEWSATVGEWQVVTISVFSRLALLMVNMAALALCAKALSRRKPAASSTNEVQS